MKMMKKDSLIDPDLRVENGYVLAFDEEAPPQLPPRVSPSSKTPPPLDARKTKTKPQISDELKRRILDDIDSTDILHIFQHWSL